MESRSDVMTLEQAQLLRYRITVLDELDDYAQTDIRERRAGVSDVFSREELADDDRYWERCE